MKLPLAAFIVSLSLSPVIGCKKKEADAPKKDVVLAAPAPAAPQAAVPLPAAPPPVKVAVDVPAPLPMVVVAAAGTKFAPPVKPAQIPAGAWYCDMGTVEFARTEPGDGRCPTCGMKLKQKK